ncbi:hypothetical protein LTR35_001754 [Friedmanniomyces endolithicus]|nr:hypothetical protein LTR35_001754 [Friedmanniomyces endolithicus]KAK0296839.1 hypothetical protein LTS00_004639 [Friedmanniomyces endolithicus]
MVRSLLRKRLTKRQARDDLRAPNTSGGEASPESTSGTSTPSSDHAGPNAFGDLNGTPPPPPSSGDNSTQRASPLSTILHRYKLRTPAAVAPQVMTNKQHSRSTHDTNSEAGFSEEDDDHSTGPVADSNTEPATAIDENAEPVQIFGEDRDSLTASTTRPTGKRTKSAEIIPNAITKVGEQVLGIKLDDKRRTRSQERRQQRVDSGAGLQEAEVVEYTRPQGMPKSLTIRKKSAVSRTSSLQVDGTTDEQKVDNASPGVSPTTSQNFSRPRLQSTQQLINFCRNSATPPDTSTNYTSPDHAPAPDDLAISPCHATSPPSNFQFPPPNPTENEKTTVRVDPPRYDPTLLPAYQWTSYSDSTSRPENPWSVTKRWTCCYCHAVTIVEQGNCARLGCSHVRCATGCVVNRGHGGGGEGVLMGVERGAEGWVGVGPVG